MTHFFKTWRKTKISFIYITLCIVLAILFPDTKIEAAATKALLAFNFFLPGYIITKLNEVAIVIAAFFWGFSFYYVYHFLNYFLIKH